MLSMISNVVILPGKTRAVWQTARVLYGDRERKRLNKKKRFPSGTAFDISGLLPP